METGINRAKAANELLNQRLNEYEREYKKILNPDLKIEIQNRREADLKSRMRQPIMDVRNEAAICLEQLEKSRKFLSDTYNSTMLRATSEPEKTTNADVILAGILEQMPPEKLLELADMTKCPALALAIKHAYVKKGVNDVAMGERLNNSMSKFLYKDVIAAIKTVEIEGWKTMFRHDDIMGQAAPGVSSRKLHLAHKIADIEKL